MDSWTAGKLIHMCITITQSECKNTDWATLFLRVPLLSFEPGRKIILKALITLFSPQPFYGRISERILQGF